MIFSILYPRNIFQILTIMTEHKVSKYDIRASGEVRAEGPNRASAATLGKMGIKIQTTLPPPPQIEPAENNSDHLGGYFNKAYRFGDFLANLNSPKMQ